MLNKVVTHGIKKRFPTLYRYVVGNPLLIRIICELDRPRFIWNLLWKRTYVGLLYLSEQVWPARRPFMKQLVKREINDANGRFDVLELGSYAGDSTLIWAGAIREKPKISGEVVCVDCFKITPLDSYVNCALHLMALAQDNGAILKLFRHNVSSSQCGHIVNLLVGRSEEILPNLVERKFDLVYVDASHVYDDVIRDIVLAAPLVREGGILCGDDLELQVGSIDISHAEKHKSSNMVYDPRTGTEYHPGVTLAVKDFFDAQISCYEGFWAMRKRDNGWEDILLVR